VNPDTLAKARKRLGYARDHEPRAEFDDARKKLRAEIAKAAPRVRVSHNWHAIPGGRTFCEHCGADVETEDGCVDIGMLDRTPAPPAEGAKRCDHCGGTGQTASGGCGLITTHWCSHCGGSGNAPAAPEADHG